jgi:hypothetical protein
MKMANILCPTMQEFYCDNAEPHFFFFLAIQLTLGVVKSTELAML